MTNRLTTADMQELERKALRRSVLGKRIVLGSLLAIAFGVAGFSRGCEMWIL